MKARFVRSGQICTKPEKHPEDVTQVGDAYHWNIGAEVEHPEAYKLVGMGIAVPADEECEKRANMTPAQLAAAQHAAKRVEAGIHPEDYELYDSGQILGYTADGEYIPGPNAQELESGDTTDSGVYIP